MHQNINMPKYKITWEELHSEIIEAKDKNEAEEIWTESNTLDTYVEVISKEIEKVEEK